MIMYCGNERGDILVANLSPSELAELSGDAKGPVPCQRRTNHNPYRAVRVALSPQNAMISFKSACRAQRKAAKISHAAGGARYVIGPGHSIPHLRVYPAKSQACVIVQSMALLNSRGRPLSPSLCQGNEST